MKLLVSDYDGTFNEDKSLSKINNNIDAVKRFMSNGNLFAFATGRSFYSIKEETSCYKIPYDYLICNNGAMVFDANNNIIESNPLPQDEIEKIKKIIFFLSILLFIRKRK